MAVSLTKMAKDLSDFQQQQLQDFTEFIDTSIEIKDASAGVQENAEQDYAAMESQVDKFTSHLSNPSDEPLIEVLTEDQQYIDKLDDVNLIKPADLAPKESLQYVDDKTKQTTEYMDDRLKQDE